MGHLEARLTKKQMITGGFIWTSCFLLLASKAPTFLIFLVLLVVAGVGSSVFHPSASSLITGVYPGKSRGRALSIYVVSGRIGAFVSILLANYVGSIYGWRMALVAWAVLGLGFAFFVGLMNDRGVLVDEKKTVFTLTPNHSRMPPILGLIAIYGIYEMLARGLSTFMPVLIREAVSLDTFAGYSVGLLILSGSVGSIIISLRSGSVEKRRLIFFLLLTTGIATSLLISSNSLVIAVLLIVFMGIAVYTVSPLTQTLISEYTLSSERTRLFGMFFTVSEGVGALTPVLMGLIADTYSLHTSFTFLAVISIMGAIISLTVRPKTG